MPCLCPTAVACADAAPAMPHGTPASHLPLLPPSLCPALPPAPYSCLRRWRACAAAWTWMCLWPASWMWWRGRAPTAATPTQRMCWRCVGVCQRGRRHAPQSSIGVPTSFHMQPAPLSAPTYLTRPASPPPPGLPAQIIIGRNQGTNMQLNDGEISGQHAAVRWSSVDKCWKVRGRGGWRMAGRAMLCTLPHPGYCPQGPETHMLSWLPSPPPPPPHQHLLTHTHAHATPPNTTHAGGRPGLAQRHAAQRRADQRGGAQARA